MQTRLCHGEDPATQAPLRTYLDHVGEVYRSHDSRYVIDRQTDRYLIYDAQVSDDEEVWSCRTVDQVYDWMRTNGLGVADFDEV